MTNQDKYIAASYEEAYNKGKEAKENYLNSGFGTTNHYKRFSNNWYAFEKGYNDN